MVLWLYVSVIFMSLIKFIIQTHLRPYSEETLETANTLPKDTVFVPFLADKPCYWGFSSFQVFNIGITFIQCVSFLYHHNQSGRLVIIQLTLFINSAIIHHAVIAINFTYEL